MRLTHRYASVVAAFAMVLAFFTLTACSDSTETQGGTSEQRPSALDTIRKTKHLKAAYVVYPPFVSKDPNTQALSGYFIELMAEVAKQGEFTIDYEEAKWGTMVSGLSSGKYDVVVSGIFPTISRSFEVSFARPVMYVGLAGVVKADDNRTWTEDALKAKGLRVAVVNGEVGHEYARKFLPDAKLTVLDTADISRAATEVLQGRADVAIAESLTLVRFAAENPGTKAVFTGKPLQVFGSTVMLRRDDPEFRAFMDTAIDFLEASGVIEGLEARYKSSSDMWLTRRPAWK